MTTPHDDLAPPLLPWPCVVGALLVQGLAVEGHDALARWEEVAPPAERPLIEATRARVLYALDRPDVAQPALERALELGHADAAALATLAHPQGERFGHARLGHGDPGQRADAACDLAWRALLDGQPDEARQLVQLARSACPGHGEAGRWQRFLDLAGAGAVAAARGELLPPPPEPLLGDAVELCPAPWSGWLSTERFARRLLGPRMFEVGLPLPAMPRPDAAPPGSALARLRSMGTCSRVLGTDADYGRLPADHPLVGAEAALDLALGLEREGRPAHVAAAEAWRVARALDELAARDAANALVGLGLRSPECGALGVEVAAWLRVRQPEQSLWWAYEASLHICADRVAHGLGLARHALALPEVDTLSLVLVVEALRWRDLHRDAGELCSGCLSHPVLGATAVQLLRQRTGRPLPTVSNRTRDRTLAA